jgi:hypothetical protein
MAFLRVVTRANGKRYWYREERWRENGKVKSKSIYIGPCRLSPFLKYSGEERRIALRYAWQFTKQHGRKTDEEIQRIQERRAAHREWLRGIEAAKLQRELEAREGARKPATEAARDRYMELREQQQAQIGAYWRTVEEPFLKNEKAAEEWTREHQGTVPPAPPPDTSAQSAAAASSDEKNGGRV